jgi:hypothetical protein
LGVRRSGDCRGLGKVEVGGQLLRRDLSDPADLGEVHGVAESRGGAGGAEGDDCLGLGRADSREHRQLRGGGGIGIEPVLQLVETCRVRRGRVVDDRRAWEDTGGNERRGGKDENSHDP